MGDLSLRFGSPSHGWLQVEMGDGRTSVTHDASDVPGDSLSMLATAGLDLLSGTNQALVEWFLEPDEASWEFHRDGDLVQVRVKESRKEAKVLTAGTVRDSALVIWRALRRLQFDPVWTAYDLDRVWSHPFPAAVVARLETALRKGAPDRPG